jgi:hypothetical protein
MNIQNAAKKLYTEIRAPRGAVNTIGVTDLAGSSFIRVMIDPSYGAFQVVVPDSYEGFPVRVERRNETSPAKHQIHFNSLH